MSTEEIALRWGLSSTSEIELTETAFLTALAEKIEKLWLENPEKLLHSLYRLDVAEEKVSRALKNPDSAQGFWELARLVLARERQKAETRAKYSGS